VAALRRALPEINHNVGRALRDALTQETLRPAFRTVIEHDLQEVAGGACD